MVGIFEERLLGEECFGRIFTVWIELLEDSIQRDVYQGAVAALPKIMVFGLVTNKRS
jgi:hypothetical protein